MKKIKEMSEDYNAKKVARKHWRTIEQQKYRNELAKNFKEMRKLWDIWHDLSKSYLEKEKYTRQYFESLWDDRKLWMDVAMELINSWKWKLVVDYLDKFKWVDYDVVAKKLIESDESVFLHYVLKIVSNLDKFEWIDNNELARKLIDMDREGEYQKYCCNRWNGWRYLLCKNLDKFNWLDYDILKSLVNTHRYNDYYRRRDSKNLWLYFIVPNLDKFIWVDYNELARLLMNKNEYELLYNNIDKFEWLDQEIVEDLFWGIFDDNYRLILDDLDKWILDRFHKLWGLSYSYMLYLIIEKIRIWVARWFPNYEDGWSSEIINKMILKSEWLLDISVAKRLITPKILSGSDYWIYEDYGDIVVKNINKFESSAHPEIANIIIEEWSEKTISLFLKDIKNFEWLDYNRIAKKLVEAWYGDVVAKYSEKFWLKKGK